MALIPVTPAAAIGRGCDSATGSLFGWSLADKPLARSTAGGQQTEFHYGMVESTQMLARNLNVSASASFAGFGINASVEASYISESSVNAYDLFARLFVRVTNPALQMVRPQLDPAALDLLQRSGWHAFTVAYGPEYIGGMVDGGQYHALIQIRTSDFSKREELRVKFSASGFGAKLDASFANELKESLKNVETRITLFQSGGIGDRLEASLDQMIEQALTFPRVAAEHPVPFLAIVESYRNTVPLPPTPDSPLDLATRNDTLEELGHKYLWYRDYRANLDYVLTHMQDFDEYQSLEPPALAEKSKALQRDFAAVTNQIEIIRQHARKAYNSIDAATPPAEYYQPAESLPKIEGQNFMLKKLEQQVTDLTVRAQRDALPAGTILPFFGASNDAATLEAAGWYLCDGRVINDPLAIQRFRGRPTPNLHDRFLMGSAANVGATGGSARISIPGRPVTVTASAWTAPDSEAPMGGPERNQDWRSRKWHKLISSGASEGVDVNSLPPFFTALFVIKVRDTSR